MPCTLVSITCRPRDVRRALGILYTLLVLCGQAGCMILEDAQTKRALQVPFTGFLKCPLSVRSPAGEASINLFAKLLF